MGDKGQTRRGKLEQTETALSNSTAPNAISHTDGNRIFCHVSPLSSRPPFFYKSRVSPWPLSHRAGDPSLGTAASAYPIRISHSLLNIYRYGYPECLKSLDSRDSVILRTIDNRKLERYISAKLETTKATIRSEDNILRYLKS